MFAIGRFGFVRFVRECQDKVVYHIDQSQPQATKGLRNIRNHLDVAPNIHVIGDAIQVAPLMPMSGHMANLRAKVAAAAVVAELLGLPLIDNPMLTNTCYSFTDAKNVIHVASVHEYVAAEKTFKTVAGSGGVSTAPTALEGVYTNNWAQNIWADTLG